MFSIGFSQAYLLVSLQLLQLGAVEVLGDLPEPRLDVIHQYDAGQDGLVLELAASLQAVSASDELIAAVVLPPHRDRVPKADLLDRIGDALDGFVVYSAPPP